MLILKDLLKPDHPGARPFRAAKNWPLSVVSSTESSIKALNKASRVSFLNKPKPLAPSLGLQHTRLHSCLGCSNHTQIKAERTSHIRVRSLLMWEVCYLRSAYHGSYTLERGGWKQQSMEQSVSLLCITLHS